MGSWGEAIILSVVVARVTFVLLFFRFYYECIGLLLLSIMSLFIEFVIGGNRLPHVESSHFSLLLGCALPLWLSGNSFDRPLAPFAGILSLGIGDTMASVIGIKFGSQKLSRDSKKTVEGTAAGIVSLILGSSIIHFFYANLNDIQVSPAV